MSREAVENVAFIGKPPKSSSELSWILRMADRLMDRDGRSGATGPPNGPDNVIPFPQSRHDEEAVYSSVGNG